MIRRKWSDHFNVAWFSDKDDCNCFFEDEKVMTHASFSPQMHAKKPFAKRCIKFQRDDKTKIKEDRNGFLALVSNMQGSMGMSPGL